MTGDMLNIPNSSNVCNLFAWLNYSVNDSSGPAFSHSSDKEPVAGVF